MSRYKKLQIPNYFRYADEDGDDIRECGLEPCAVVIGADGWYYDRIAKTSWYEYQGQAWTNDRTVEQFLFELEQHDTKWLSPTEVQAIRTLQVYGTCPPELTALLRRYQYNVMLHDVYWDAFKYSRDALAKIEQETVV